MVNFSLNLGLNQVVTDATRDHAILVCVFLSALLYTRGFTSQVINSISDHKGILISLHHTVLKHWYEYTSYHDYSMADDVIDTLSRKFDVFNEISYTGDVKSLVFYFGNLVKKCVETYVPLKRKMLNFRG